MWRQGNQIGSHAKKILHLSQIMSFRCDMWWFVTCSIFQNQGTSLSCLADAVRRFGLSCLVLFCLVWPKINDHHTCLWIIATLIEIGLRNALGDFYIWTKSEMDIHMHWKIMICRKLPNTKQDGARPSMARQDEEGAPGFKKYFNHKFSSVLS